MTAGTGSEPNVVRAERFELVDRQGRVRAVLGTLASDEAGHDVVGLELRDGSGSARAWLAFEDGWGTQLCFAEGGNQVLLVDLVEDTAAAAAPGPAIRLCDATGEPVVEWRVTGAGEVLTRGTGAGERAP